MSEIKVGEYVRTNKGIDKIIDIYTIKDDIEIEAEKNCFDLYEITKHRPNIIDLIEVGDYVNGHKVEQVYLEGTRPYIKLSNREKGKIFEGRIYNDEIKSIVTHEQFEESEYRVNE